MSRYENMKGYDTTNRDYRNRSNRGRNNNRNWMTHAALAGVFVLSILMTRQCALRECDEGKDDCNGCRGNDKREWRAPAVDIEITNSPNSDVIINKGDNNFNPGRDNNFKSAPRTKAPAPRPAPRPAPKPEFEPAPDKVPVIETPPAPPPAEPKEVQLTIVRKTTTRTRTVRTQDCETIFDSGIVTRSERKVIYDSRQNSR